MLLGTRVRGAAGLALACATVLGACSSGTSSSSTSTTAATATPPTGDSVPLAKGGSAGKAAYLVYWDQNEEVDFLSMPSGTQGQLLPGVGPQRADVRPARRPLRRSGTTPRCPASTTSAAPSPTSSPPTARSSTSPTARSAARRCTCPAPTRCRARASAATRPPTANGVFNNNQTYTGCAVDKAGNVFANDIATAQGDYPPPEQRAAGGVVRPQLHDLLHRLRPDDRWVRARTTPTGRAGWPSPG